jgi:hypothetical protein
VIPASLPNHTSNINIMPQTADNLLSDPEIANAYEDVRDDKSATTWMVLKDISGTSDSLKLDSTGEGDIAEMVEHLGDDEAAYAFVRMTVGNDEMSQRVKFVFVSWCGECSMIPYIFLVLGSFWGKRRVEEMECCGCLDVCVGVSSKVCDGRAEAIVTCLQRCHQRLTHLFPRSQHKSYAQSKDDHSDRSSQASPAKLRHRDPNRQQDRPQGVRGYHEVEKGHGRQL